MAAVDEQIQEEREAIQAWTEQSLSILGPCPPDLRETTIQVPLSDGTKQRTIVVWPASTSAEIKKLPLIVLYHGGSWTTGGPELMLGPARGYASLLGAVVASCSYKYAPEQPFPAPMHSAWDVAAWLSRPENLNSAALAGESVEVDPSLGLVLGGVSAGAHLAAVIAGVAAAVAAAGQEEESETTTTSTSTSTTSTLIDGLTPLARPITGVFLSVPLLLHETIVPAEYASLWTSRVEHADAPMVDAATLAETEARLQPDHRSPWYSPLNLDLGPERLAGKHAARVYLQAGDLDILRDDAVVYERALRDRGVAETRIDVLQGVDHAGWCTMPLLAAHSDEMRTKSLDGMAWLLGKEWDKSQKLPY